MKGLFTILIFILLCGNQLHATQFSKNGNPNKNLSKSFIEQVLLSEEVPHEKISIHSKMIDDIVLSFNSKRSKAKSEAGFLENVFYKVHRKYLKNYKAYDSFENLLDNGVYGCLTGTAFLAIILDKLDYQYDIVETNYHIYLMVQTNEGEVLMESTDPIDGFVKNQSEIKNRIESTLIDESPNDSEYNYTVDIFNQIDLNQLIGLQFYNQAINAYNAQNISEALSQLNEAAKHYPSQRIIELLEVIDSTINNSVENYLNNFEELNALASN